MARNPKIKSPEAREAQARPPGRVQDRLAANPPDPNEAPQFVGFGTHLRERATGIIHPWNAGMAGRSDLVELYDPQDDESLSSLSHLSDFDAAGASPGRPAL